MFDNMNILEKTGVYSVIFIGFAIFIYLCLVFGIK